LKPALSYHHFIFIEAGVDTVSGGVDNDNILVDSGLCDQIGDDDTIGRRDKHTPTHLHTYTPTHTLFLS
jgi:hypothetical protein